MEEPTAEPTGPESGVNHLKNKNKKRKSSQRRFLQNAKGFGRKNSFGRGAELDQEEYSYFVEILEAFNANDDNEERVTMANNVYEQVLGKEIKASSNQLSSRVLENLLSFTDETTLERLMQIFVDNFRVVCCDKFASHVLQKMLLIAVIRYVGNIQPETESTQDKPSKKFSKNNTRNEIAYNFAQSYSEQHVKACGKFVKKVGKFLINNLEEFAWDAFANYVIRQCVSNLAGIAEFKSGKGEIDIQNFEVPEKWSKLLNEFSDRLLAWPQFVELPYNEYTSVLLQNLVLSLGRSNGSYQINVIGAKLIGECFLIESVPSEELNVDEFTNLPKVFQYDCSVRLLEALLTVAEEGLFKEHLYKKLFYGKILLLSKQRTNNFAVQKLIDNVKDKHIMEDIFNELCASGLEEILQLGHTGVVVSLAKACARLACQQGKFMKELLEALHCVDANGEKLVVSILKLMPPEVLVKQENTPIHIHGSIIMQSILEFNKPIKIVSAILETKNERLSKIFTDPKGSFIANAFVKSKFVGEKSREKLIRILEGCYMDLALSAHGSRVLELLYGVADASQKEAIVKELSQRTAQLNSKPWGMIINKKLLVETYRRNPNQWHNTSNSGNKRSKNFEKLISSDVSNKKRKKC